MIEGRDLQERSRPRELQEHEDEGHSLPGRWVNSHELRAGDWIITRSGTRALITEIRQHFEPAFPVSNLTIFGHHNYSVGDVGVLVHNVSVCDGTIADLRKLRADGMSEDKINDWLRSKTDDNGNRLYDDDEIEKALEEILAPKGALTTYGKNAMAHFRSHAQHIRETARKLGIEIPKSPSNPETLAAMKAFIDKVVNEGAKKTGKFKDVVDAEWYKLGDAIVVRRPDGEWLSFLDYSKKSPLSNLWDSM